MKNYVCIVMSAVLALCLFGCANSDADTATSATESTAASAATEATETASSYPTEPDGSIKQGRVPNVVGRDAEFAQLDMKAAGFVTLIMEEIPSDLPAGTIVEQSVEAYITLPVDTEVILYVSTGIAP